MAANDVTVNDVERQDRWFYLSAYAIAVKHGYTGTEEEWINDQRQAVLDAQAARDAAQDARDDAQSARNDAQGYASAASDSAGNAEDYAADAVTVKQAAEAARDLAAEWASGSSTGEPGASNNAQYYAGVAAAAQGTATGAAAAAEAAKVAAVTAKDAVEGFIDDAEAWATGGSGGTPTETNNSKYYAEQAAASAQDLDDAVAAAEAAAADALTYKNAAAGSATEASGYVSTVSGYAETAGQARDTAVTYGQMAFNSATAAGEAKTAAETAQGKAEDAQEAAETAESNAAGSATAAGNAQTAAEAAQTAAESAESNAAASAAAAEAAAESIDPDEFNRRIFAAFPTGSFSNVPVASFPDGADGIPVKSLIVDIALTQSGSGDPAPSNIRDFSVYDGLTIANTHDGDTDTYSVSWEGKIPCGTYNPVTGELSITHDIAVSNAGGNFDYYHAGATVSGRSLSANSGYCFFNIAADIDHSTSGNSVCDRLKYSKGNGTASESNTFTVRTASNYHRITFVADIPNWGTTSEEHAAAMGTYLVEQYQAGRPMYFAIALNTPNIIQLTPTEIKTVLGENAFSADTGNINKLTYRADPTLYIEKKLGAGA